MIMRAPFLKITVPYLRFSAKEEKVAKGNKYKYICQKCEITGNVHEFFCNGCHYLKDPTLLKQFNYFELFGIDANYNTSKEELDKRYRKLQRGLHPDKYVNDSEEVQNLATEYSTYINMAYRVLQDDERRAKYLLKLKAGNILNEEVVIQDQDFLLKIMQLNEEIEDIADIAELKEKEKELGAEMKQLVNNIGEYFEKEKYPEIVDELKKVRFCKRALEQADKKERELVQ
eukprot:TRINITY_DN2466_c0_g1_i3.p1 TRINITY_DN2466_c0_g1~~TRINITY_DN2466_c0_g1_i3.p1  ORF type:complete len:230 (+),score=69.32 TRINITY_DN2466_c0_g1_i3:104-793(+)